MELIYDNINIIYLYINNIICRNEYLYITISYLYFFDSILILLKSTIVYFFHIMKRTNC